MTTNRNHWSEKEENILFKIIDDNKDYILEYSLQLASMKLNRSLSAVRQHYYYHKNKIDKKSLQKEFKSLIKSGKYKLSKKGKLFIVEI
jgi:hypothetical protein